MASRSLGSRITIGLIPPAPKAPRFASGTGHQRFWKADTQRMRALIILVLPLLLQVHVYIVVFFASRGDAVLRPSRVSRS